MAEHQKGEIIKWSACGKFCLYKSDGDYYLFDTSSGKPEVICAPGGYLLYTSYESLAERLFEDLQKFGTRRMSPDSLLPWHYSMCEQFRRLEHKEAESLLDDCFIKKADWTYDCCHDEAWVRIFGIQKERISEIRDWLSKCSHMQMNAICCVSDEYHSINIPFILASIMENHEEKDRNRQFKLLANMIADNSPELSVSDLMKVFKNFDLYYGIHLKEEGLIIHKSSFGIRDESYSDSFNVTEEMLVGRNYYHYSDGEMDDEQPLSLKHDLSSRVSEEDEDTYAGTGEIGFGGDWLPDYLPADCWVKRISAPEGDGSLNFIIALEVEDGKITETTVLRDEFRRTGGDMVYFPGMTTLGDHYYEEVDIDECEVVEDEIDMLRKGRYLTSEFSFIGKKLPREIMKKYKLNGDDRQYLLCLQSAHRSAYMDLIINIDENGAVEDYEFSTYQSTGSGYWDMFSRPQEVDDRNEEAVDMPVYIMDKYTDKEYAELVDK